MPPLSPPIDDRAAPSADALCSLRRYSVSGKSPQISSTDAFCSLTLISHPCQPSKVARLAAATAVACKYSLSAFRRELCPILGGAMVYPSRFTHLCPASYSSCNPLVLNTLTITHFVYTLLHGILRISLIPRIFGYGGRGMPQRRTSREANGERRKAEQSVASCQSLVASLS